MKTLALLILWAFSASAMAAGFRQDLLQAAYAEKVVQVATQFTDLHPPRLAEKLKSLVSSLSSPPEEYYQEMARCKDLACADAILSVQADLFFFAELLLEALSQPPEEAEKKLQVSAALRSKVLWGAFGSAITVAQATKNREVERVLKDWASVFSSSTKFERDTSLRSWLWDDFAADTQDAKNLLELGRNASRERRLAIWKSMQSKWAHVLVCGPFQSEYSGSHSPTPYLSWVREAHVLFSGAFAMTCIDAFTGFLYAAEGTVIGPFLLVGNNFSTIFISSLFGDKTPNGTYYGLHGSGGVVVGPSVTLAVGRSCKAALAVGGGLKAGVSAGAVKLVIRRLGK